VSQKLKDQFLRLGVERMLDRPEPVDLHGVTYIQMFLALTVPLTNLWLSIQSGRLKNAILIVMDY
jgi:hypothetical protein